MEKCNFNYLYNEPSVENINLFIIYLIDKYKISFNDLKSLNDNVLLNYNKNDYVKLIKFHNEIILSLIKDVVVFFPQLRNIPHIVFIHGSFAKRLNRVNSDIDLNILYPNQFKNEILPIEELIAIILQKVIGYRGRDKIHPVMVYTCNELNENLIESTQECTITFPNKQIYTYNCRPNSDETMYKIKNSSRKYNDFFRYIKNNIASNKCEEWSYSYKMIFTNCEEYNLYGTLKKADEDNLSIVNYNDYNKLIMNLINTIQEYNFDINQENTVSNINKYLKVENLGYIYKTLALIRRYLFINKVSVQGLDFFEIFKKPKFKELFSTTELEEIENNIFKYIWQLSRIENIFYKTNINFSSRSYDKFNYELFYKRYKDLYGDNLIEVQDITTFDLHKSLEKVLRKIKNI